MTIKGISRTKGFVLPKRGSVTFNKPLAGLPLEGRRSLVPPLTSCWGLRYGMHVAPYGSSNGLLDFGAHPLLNSPIAVCDRNFLITHARSGPEPRGHGFGPD